MAGEEEQLGFHRAYAERRERRERCRRAAWARIQGEATEGARKRRAGDGRSEENIVEEAMRRT